MMMAATVTETARAKINLFLHVTGRRDDGYHLLDSLVAFAEAGDVVTASGAEDLRLDLDGPMAGHLPAEGDNIVLRAARALAAGAALPARARLRLTKTLPVAAGIGGGSADAAATLRALGRLWQLDLPTSQWQSLALSLGADVPVCLHGQASRMSGIGEMLSAVPPLPPAWLVLVNPMTGLSTPAVFTARQGPFSPPAPSLPPLASPQALAEFLRLCRNDLTDAACAVLPVVGDMLTALRGQADCLLARMSGSGATCFGLFADAGSAAAATRALSTQAPCWWIKTARLCSAS